MQVMSTAMPDIIPKQSVGNEFSADVMVRNDDTFPAEAAILALHTVLPGCSLEQALQKAAEIHHNGVASVFTGSREVCELYADQLTLHGLDAFVS